mmetsp:Transcript_145058/g.252998  ORF Transcript_145058/g.252998 Transcript_145058/m.252998 type:complete len:98 (+) Transcript_145058:2-295(+)
MLTAHVLFCHALLLMAKQRATSPSCHTDLINPVQPFLHFAHMLPSSVHALEVRLMPITMWHQKESGHNYFVDSCALYEQNASKRSTKRQCITKWSKC